MANSIISRFMRLALLNPAHITPANGKAYEKWLGGNIGLHSQPNGSIKACAGCACAGCALSRTDNFVLSIFEFLDKLKALKHKDFLWFWFGIRPHPLFAPAEEEHEVALANHILNGEIMDESQVREFCSHHYFNSNVEVLVQRALAFIEVLEFVDELDNITPTDLTLAARFEERALALKQSAGGVL